MSRLLKSRDSLMKCLGFVLLFGFISLGAIGGCNNNGGGGDGGDGDGGQQPAQVASACDGLTPTMTGTNGDDNLTGTEGDDIIVGLAGNDTIDGLGGNDTICGDAGNDNITGGPGNDVLDGGPDNDLMIGGGGDDVFVEVPGSIDDIDAGEGSDTLDFSNITDAQALTRGDGSLLKQGLAIDLRPRGSGVLLLIEADSISIGGDPPENYIGSPFDDILIVDPSTAPRIIDGGPGLDTLIVDSLGQPVTFDNNNNVFQFPGFGDIQVLNFEEILAVDWEPVLKDDSAPEPEFSIDPAAGCFKSNDNQGNNGVTFCPAGPISRGSWTFENPLPAKDVTVGITYGSNPDRSNVVYFGVLCLPAGGGEPLLLQGGVINQQTPPIGFTLNDLDFVDFGLITTQDCKKITVEAVNESINQNLFLELDSVVLVPKEFFDVTPPVIKILSPMDGETVNLKDLELSISVSDDSNPPVIPVTIQFPQINTCFVSTVLSVPDGGIVLLGDIRCLSEGLKELGVPILGTTPPLKELFLNIEISATDIARNSIMLMVEPRILIQEEEEKL